MLVAGLAEAFAGALSMGAGEFISARAEAQVHQTEIAKEEAEMRDDPAFEQREMAALLQHEGIAHDAACGYVREESLMTTSERPAWKETYS